MRDTEIVKMILDENSFESKMKLAELVGYDRLKTMVTEMRFSGMKIPHVMDDILGTLLYGNEEKRLAKLLEESTPEQVEVLVRAFGSQKCKRASKLILDPAKAHLVIDYATTMSCKESEDFVTKIEETGVTNYGLAQKMVIIHGLEKTEKDIEVTGYSRPVKHIVADIMGPLRANKSENTL